MSSTPTPCDDGEAAVQRERNLHASHEDAEVRRRMRAAAKAKRTDDANAAFKEKMDAFRNGGMPGYIGPRAGRDA